MNKDARVSMKDACNALGNLERSLSSSLNSIQDHNMQSKLREQINSIKKINKECEDIALGISNHG